MLSLFAALHTAKPRGVVLLIVDGFGESAWPEGNGILQAHMPVFEHLKSH
jgi:bisphosphoglycerate-independent phosphoglycerate mutase (AlkP superfamily)